MRNAVKRPRESFPLDNRDLTQSPAKVAKSTTVFDPFFGIKVESPRFTVDVFNTYCSGMTKIRISALADFASTSSIFMGVIAESTGIQKSSSNNDYLVWHLSDLKNDHKVKLLIFGEAARKHHSLQVGVVVAITNPELAEDNKAGTPKLLRVPAFKVVKSLQIMLIGLCPDFGYCTGQRKDGERCTNYVNTSHTSVCSYHIQVEAKKFRAIRGSLSATSNERPKCMMARSPQKRKQTSEVHKSSRSKTDKKSVNVNLEDRSVIASKARLGHKVMQKLNETIEKEATPRRATSKLATPKLAILKTPKAEVSNNVLQDFLNRQSTLDRIKQAARRVGAPRSSQSTQRENMVDLSSPKKSQPKSLSLVDD